MNCMVTIMAALDTIYGGDGNDLIVGGMGADDLSGGAGADIFAFEGHHDFGDIIRDFDSSDRLFFDQTIFASSYEVNQNFSSYFRFEQVGSNTQVFIDKTGSGSNFELVATLQNYNATQIDVTKIGLGTLKNNLILEFNEDELISHSVNISENETITSIDNLPDWLEYDQVNGSIYGTPSNSDVGSVELKLHVTSTSGSQREETVVIEVNNVNDAPVFDFTPPSSTSEDVAFSYQLTASDIDANVVR